jgi:multidrug efflux pump subunit AcrA (membrane-fusion protein)
MIRKYVLPLAALVMLFFALYHVVRAQQKPSKLEPPVPPARSPFGTGVAGAGLVEAQTENISVGSNLPGIVTKVFVKVGQKVKEGDPLFMVDNRALTADRLVKEQSLLSARAQLNKLKQMPRTEEVPPLEAKVREMRANLADQEDQLRRARRLFSQRAIGEEERVRREMAARMAAEQLRKAEADLALLRDGAWKPDVRIAEVAVGMAEAQLKQVEMDLERLTVRALVDGEVLQVNVRPGEYVATQAGQALIVLGNVNRLHVRVDVDEHDIPRLPRNLETASARAMLRGEPSQHFALRFVRVEPYVIPKKSLTGDNTERVDTRVLQLIYALEPGRRRVYVGQQLDVYIEATPRKKGE